MRFAYPSAALVIAVVLGACAQATSRDTAPPEIPPQPGPAPRVDAPQPIEPEAIRPGPRAARNDLVVLLPKANGSAGAVVVGGTGGGKVVLSKPYAAARMEGPGRIQPFTYDSSRVKEIFGVALAALPGRPASFLLYFLEGKDEFTRDSENEVARIFAEISARLDPEVSIIGHTDAIGTMRYNDQLSLQRAQRVRDELVHRGIPTDRIEVSGRGKREPLVRTPEGVAEPRNRRVEINVR